MSRIINQLFQKYGLEGINVPYTTQSPINLFWLLEHLVK